MVTQRDPPRHAGNREITADMEPFDTLRESLPGWTLAITALEGVMGFCDTTRRTIWVDVNLPHREMRTTAMHEMIHAMRGDTSDNVAAERQVEVETARRLIPKRALLVALTQTTHPEDLADLLDVDVALLRVRLHHLETELRGAVRARLAAATPSDPTSQHCALGRWWRHHDQPGPVPCDATCCAHTTVLPDATIIPFPPAPVADDREPALTGTALTSGG